MIEIALTIRVLLALVFLSAAIGKIRHRSAFQGVVVNYRLIPEAFAPAVTFLLPPIETAIAGALLFAPPPWPEAIAALLLLLFAAAMAFNLGRGRRHIDCGCFQSAFKQTLSWTLVIRNAGLALLLAVPAAPPVNIGPPPAATQASAIEGLVSGVVLFVLLQAMNILWSVVPAWRLRGSSATGVEK